LDSLNSTGSGGVGPGDYDILIGIAKLVAERIKPEVERTLQPLFGEARARNEKSSEGVSATDPRAGIWKASGRDQVQADWSGVGPRCTG